MILQIKSPEEMKTSSPSPPSSCPSFSLLPDEITVNYLARIPRSYYPTLSLVSKSFHSLLSSTELYVARSNLGSTEQCLYVCLRNYNQKALQWFMLWVNPNRNLPNSSVTKNKKKTVSSLLVPIPPSTFPALSISTKAVVGSEIYVIGGKTFDDEEPSSAVTILDCRSHTWRDAPSMNVARMKARSCVCDGKIYVLEGCEGLKDDEPWAKVFDLKTQTWEGLPIPSPNEARKPFRYIFRFKEIEGKIYYGNSSKMYAYDTKQGTCEPCENKDVNKSFTFPESQTQCVIENVSYSCGKDFNDESFACRWYDKKDQIWREIKGLDSLRDKTNGTSRVSASKLVSCGGKLLLIWEVYKKYYRNNKKKIWGAEIVVENATEVRFGKVWSGLMLCLRSPNHVISCNV